MLESYVWGGFALKELFRAVPLFRLLDDQELDRISQVAKLEDKPAGEVLFRTGDVSDSFYIVLSGRVKITIPPQDGKEERILYLGKGKFFGEMGVIRNTLRNADASIQDTAQLVTIHREDFDLLMSMDEQISKKVMGAYMNRLIELREEKDSGGSVERPSSMLFFSTGVGAGASFLAANLAAKIHKMTQKSVLVIDMDIEGPTQHLYGGYKGDVGGLRSLFSSPQITKEAIKGACRKLSSGVDLLGGPGVPGREQATPEIMPELIRNALQSHYYVIVDTTSSLNPITESLMQVCDATYLAVAPNIVSVRRAETNLERIEELGLGSKIRLLLNKHEKGRGITREILEDHLGKKVIGQLSYDDKGALEALNAGQPLVVQAPDSKLAVDAGRAARQALSIPGKDEAHRSGFSIWNLFGS